MAKKGTKQQKYTKEFKIKVVKSYLSGEYGGLKKTAEYYELKDKRQVKDWLKIYKEKGTEAFLIETRGRLSSGRPRSAKLDEMSLEEQVKWLKMENDILKKAKALQRD